VTINASSILITKAAPFFRFIRQRLLFRCILHELSSLAEKPNSTVEFWAGRDVHCAHLLSFGSFEKPYLTLACQIIRHLFPDQTKSVILDIGANIGTHALAFSDVCDTVLAYEPDPAIYYVLKANIEISNKAGNIFAYQYGLGSSNATLSYLRSTKDNRGTGRFITKGPTGEHIPERHMLLEVKTGDNALSSWIADGYRICAIKIDVEGMENEVILGLGNTLIKERPIVFFEAHDLESAKLCFQTLSTYGYHGHYVAQRKRLFKFDAGPLKILNRLYGRDALTLAPFPGTESYFVMLCATPSALENR
jgi:FkbM family methyltransferase